MVYDRSFQTFPLYISLSKHNKGKIIIEYTMGRTTKGGENWGAEQEWHSTIYILYLWNALPYT